MAGLGFCKAETRGFSLAQSEVLNFARKELSQFREAVGLTSPVSKSTSKIIAREKPSLTISSSRMGKISSGRSAESSRRAADSLTESRETNTLDLGRSCGVAIRIYSVKPQPTSTATTPSTTGGDTSNPSRSFHRDLRLFHPGQLRARNNSHQTDGIRVFQISIDRGHHHARFDRD